MNAATQRQNRTCLRRFKPYPKYKDSGVEWLGEIPEHWEVRRVGHVATKVGSGKTPLGGSQVYVGSGVKLLRSQNVHIEGLRLDDVVFIDEATDEEMSGTRVRPDDVLLNITGASLGRTSLVPSDIGPANVNQHVCIISPFYAVVNSGFLHKSICSANVQSQIFSIENGTSREGLTFQQVRSLVIPFPPDLSEQRSIFKFLDRETDKIDALVAKKERLIGLLQEKRTALITRAVTKGLDPNVPMKDSGVGWLGEIPEHWEVVRLKYAATLQRGHDLPAEDRDEGNIPVVTSAGVTATHAHAAARGPGIVTGRYGTIGVFHLIETDYWPLNTTLYTTDLHGNHPKFLWYMLHNLTDIFLLNSSKSAVPGVDRNDLHPTPTAIPPSQSEQKAIAAFLDNETTRIDALVSTVRRAVEKLLEYRTTLISAAVTGKIDVREEAA